MNSLPFWFVRLKYEEVYGKSCTWEQLIERIHNYGLRQCLELVCRLSSYLCDDFYHPAVQQAVTKELFQSDFNFVWNRVEEIKKASTAPGHLLFTELQLLNFCKIVFIELPDDANTKRNPDLRAFAEALLMVNDLVLVQQDLQVSTDYENFSSDEWHQYFVRSVLFHHPFDWVKDIARSFELYLTDNTSLKTNPSYINLPEQAGEIVGVSVDLFWTVMFSFAEYWGNSTTPRGSINLHQYLGKHNFEPNVLNRAVSFFAANVGELGREVKERYRYESMLPYHLIPFAIHPVVRSEDHLCCISAQLLRERLARGLFHLFLQSKVPKAMRDRFLTYMGAVFADYLNRLMHGAVTGSAAIYFPDAIFEPLVSGKVCDGILFDEDCAVIMEYKATLFPLATRTGTDETPFQGKIKDLFLDSIDQLDATIDAIRSGKLQTIGVDPSKIKRFYPIIVSLETVSMTEFQYQLIWKYILHNGRLRGKDIRSVQVIEVGEMERIETGMKKGMRLSQIIQDKLNDGWKNQSFNNYWFSRRHESYMPIENENLSAKFSELRRKAITFLTDHLTDRSQLDSDIRLLAYTIWETKGRIHGHDLEDWLEAEELILFG